MNYSGCKLGFTSAMPSDEPEKTGKGHLPTVVPVDQQGQRDVHACSQASISVSSHQFQKELEAIVAARH